MMDVQFARLTLHFGFTARTSRETMSQRESWLIRRRGGDGRWLYGECNYFARLAAEPYSQFRTELRGYCSGTIPYDALGSSAVRCGADMIESEIPDTNWTCGRSGIPINGLIWMDGKEQMRKAIAAKLDAGFRVLKLKIGGIDFEDELDLVSIIRSQFAPSDLELRLDANGSFSPENAMQRLQRLAPFGIHSIEQPIRAGQWDAMSRLCRHSPVDIALDEELIGLRTDEQKHQLVQAIRPAYLILKPSLCGGLRQAAAWIETARQCGVGWWLTSALESSVGLLHLGAFVSRYDLSLPQGLGTGQIYTDNIGSSLALHGALLYCKGRPWFDCDMLNNLDWQ